MTPEALIARVKGMFDILYFDDDAKIQILLRNTLSVFQEKAGGLRNKITFELETNTADLPEDYMSIVSCRDADGKFHITDISDATITVTERGDSTRPYTFEYFIDHEKIAFSGEDQYDIPNDVTSVIIKHFHTQLNNRNTKRERDMELSMGNTPDLPGEDTFKADLMEIETDMEENYAFIPPLMVMTEN